MKIYFKNGTTNIKKKMEMLIIEYFLIIAFKAMSEK